MSGRKAWEQRLTTVPEGTLTPQQLMEKLSDMDRRLGHYRFAEMMENVNNALGCESAASLMIRKQCARDRALELQLRHQMRAIDRAEKQKAGK